ncbi:MAG: cyclic nucleotide-binding/CBS domain-containing protein [Candidatus Micrarchaeia archaeon]
MYSDTRSLIVSDVMSKPVITANGKDSIKSIANKMKRYDVSSIVIVDKQNKPIGIVTEGDIVKRILSRKRNLLFVKASHVMSKPVVSVKKDLSLEAAAKMMVSKKIKKLCVVGDDGVLTGIISEGDIVKNASYLIDVLKEIIETGYIERKDEG